MRSKILNLLILTIFSLINLNTNAQVGIGTSDPTTMLDINGTLRLDHASKGNGKILGVENNGYVRWKKIEYFNLIKGNLSNTGIANFRDNNVPTYTNATITLPPGTYLVNTILILSPHTLYSESSSSFTTIYFTDSASSSLETQDYEADSAKHISGKLSGPSRYGLIDGSVVITNNEATDKTYHIWAIKQAFKTNNAINSTDIDLRYFASGYHWGENTIYAIPITL